MKAALERHGVGMVAVGLENLGVEEFVQGNYWQGGQCSLKLALLCMHFL